MQTDDNEQGGLTFEIQKNRLSIKLTAPYSEERRRAASELAKQSMEIMAPPWKTRWRTIYQRSELNWLIYNAPLEYAELILNGDPEKYLKAATEYKPLDS